MNKKIEKLLVKLGRMEDAPLFWISPKVENSLRENKYLKQENKQLKEQVQYLQEKVILLRASEPMLELEKYYGERDKYKDVIEEVREYTNDKLFDDYTYCSYEDLKQNINKILDKAKENK